MKKVHGGLYHCGFMERDIIRAAVGVVMIRGLFLSLFQAGKIKE
jgi:hypothetical protein